MSEVIDKLEHERAAARWLLEELRAETGDDEQLAHDMVHAETSLFEAIDRALARRLELNALQAAIATQAKTLKARADRMEQQVDRIEAALERAMQLFEGRAVERPAGTLYMQRQQDKLVLADNFIPPPEYARNRPPEPDKIKLRLALANGERIAGASLQPQQPALRVRNT